MAKDAPKTKFFIDQMIMFEEYVDKTIQYWLDNDLPVSQDEAVSIVEHISHFRIWLAFEAYDSDRDEWGLPCGSGQVNIVGRRIVGKCNFLIHIYKKDISYEEFKNILNSEREEYGESFFQYDLEKFKKKETRSK